MGSASAGVGSGLPYQGDSSGKYLTTDGTVASWATVAGGSGVDTVGTFSASAQTNGASISGTTMTFGPVDVSGGKPGMLPATGLTDAMVASGAAIAGSKLAAASRTLAGAVNTSTQVFGGLKGFDAGAFVPAASDHTTPVIIMGNVADGFFGLWTYPDGNTTPTTSNFRIGSDTAGVLYLRASVAKTINILVDTTTVVSISGTSIDATGLGNGGSIKLKSPDGTTYTATIANGGTWSIV